jgi:imidazole glycerol-phosphate synthase subunit HisF
MLFPRVIPALLLRERGLVKTVRFRKPVYVGDPLNTIKIFNDKEVDELVLLDIAATTQGRGPDIPFLAEACSEAFVPVAYGGGITTVEQMHALFTLGVEKVVVNSAAHDDPLLIRRAADRFGSQSVVASLDVKAHLLRGYRVHRANGTWDTGIDPIRYAQHMQKQGAGELLLTAIDRDGTFKGYDLDLIRAVSGSVDIPVVAFGGAASVADLGRAFRAGASAVAAGSLFVFQPPHRAVLISFPSRKDLAAQFIGSG